MNNIVLGVEDIKHFNSEESITYNDCLYLLEDIEHDLWVLVELPVRDNFFYWKHDEILEKIHNIQRRLPYNKEIDLSKLS